MKLTLRFVLLITALLVAVGASAYAGWRSLGQLDSALSRVVSTDMERLLAVTHTRRLFRSLVVLERDYMLSSSAEERKGMEKKMATSSKELLEQLDKYARLMPPEDRAAIEDIRGARDRWLVLSERVREAARKGDTEAAANLAKQHTKDPVSWEAVIGKLVKASETRLATQVAATHATYLGAKHSLLAVSLGAALLAAVFGTVIFLGIRRTVREVVDLNTNLEGIVAQRTAALQQRERSLRLVLDSTGDGMIGVRADGTLAGGASAAAERWFGEAKSGTPIAAYLYPNEELGRENFEVAFEQLFDDLLPWEILVAQMPQRIEREQQVLEIEYKQVSDDSSDVRLLLLVRDVSSRVQSEKAEVAAREQQSLVSKLLTDKQGFGGFVSDAERLIQSIATAPSEHKAKQDLHTLKGNVAIYGLGTMAAFCHHIETRLADEGGLPTPAEVTELSTMLRVRLEGIETFLSGLDRKVLEVDENAHEELVKSLWARKDYRDILTMVELWAWPRTAEHLTRLRAQAEQVAKRLDKSITVEIEHDDLRVPAAYLQQFWPALGHVVRNAVDHGVESEEARTAAGKPAAGRLTLRTWQTENELCVEVADDGPGIDPDLIRQVARDKGLDVADDAKLVDLIFADGFSTRSEVTEVSGRGVGLAATREACEQAGGRVEVISERGKGTRFVFAFRRPVVKTSSLETLMERRWSLTPHAGDDASGKIPKAPKLPAQRSA